MYNEHQLVSPSSAFDIHNPFIGRLETLTVAPPRSVYFLKKHIASTENIQLHRIAIHLTRDEEFPLDDSFVLRSTMGSLEHPIAVVTAEHSSGQAISTDIFNLDQHGGASMTLNGELAAHSRPHDCISIPLAREDKPKHSPVYDFGQNTASSSVPQSLFRGFSPPDPPRSNAAPKMTRRSSFSECKRTSLTQALTAFRY